LTEFKSKAAFEAISRKLTDCRENHDCCTQEESLPLLPYRVIDLGSSGHPEDIARLIEPKDTHARYAALSYCWGMAQQPIMTTRDSLHDLMVVILPDRIPQTIKDAMFVTRRLEIQYLWVDVFCIVQDCSTDKEIQTASIKTIFSDSYLTISAAQASSCQDGFLQYRPRADIWCPGFELPYRCPNGVLSTLCLQDRCADLYVAASQPLDSRAWPLEERLLSHRILIYADRGIIWQCSNEQTFLSGQRKLDSDARINGHPLLREFPLREPASRTRREDPEDSWAIVLEDYTMRRMSYGIDRLRAIAGLAERFQSEYFARNTTDYHAGLWFMRTGSDFEFTLAQLCWYSRRVRPIWLDEADDAAPSWSWASVGYDVLIPAYGRESRNTSGQRLSLRNLPQAEILDCTTSPRSSLHPMGRVVQGSLRLRSYSHPDNGEEKDIRRESDFYRTQDQNRAFPLEKQFLHVIGLFGLLLIKHKDGTFRRVGTFKFNSERIAIRELKSWSVQDVTIV
jgi:hypothetical protein